MVEGVEERWKLGKQMEECGFLKALFEKTKRILNEDTDEETSRMALRLAVLRIANIPTSGRVSSK